jgi:hypothetical protein
MSLISKAFQPDSILAMDSAETLSLAVYCSASVQQKLHALPVLGRFGASNYFGFPRLIRNLFPHFLQRRF